MRAEVCCELFLHLSCLVRCLRVEVHLPNSILCGDGSLAFLMGMGLQAEQPQLPPHLQLVKFAVCAYPTSLSNFCPTSPTLPSLPKHHATYVIYLGTLLADTVELDLNSDSSIFVN